MIQSIFGVFAVQGGDLHSIAKLLDGFVTLCPYLAPTLIVVFDLVRRVFG